MVNSNFVSVEFLKIFFPKPYYLASNVFSKFNPIEFFPMRNNGSDKKPYVMDFFFSQPENTTYCMQLYSVQ